MKEIIITNKRFVSSDNKFNHYIVDINGFDVRVYENINGNGFGLSMKDVCKVFNYSTIEELKQSKEWEQLSNKLNTAKPLSRSSHSNEVEYVEAKAAMDYSSLEQKESSQNNHWQEWAGINGAIQDKTDVVFYAGGTLDQAAEGIIPILFRANGSGHVANQNISWDEFGNLIVRGTFESNKDENRIVIDPSDRSIKLYNNKNQLMYNLTFSDNNGYVPKLSIWERDVEGKAIGRTIVKGGSYRVDNLDIIDTKYIEVTPGYIRLVDGINEKSITAKD